MAIIIVRHGETDCNEGQIHQGDSEYLNTRGLSQAAALAEGIRSWSIRNQVTKIFHSPAVRTSQTATIVGNALSNTPLVSDSRLIGIRRPSLVIGRLKSECKSIIYETERNFGAHSPIYDEETFESVRNRVLGFMNENNILSGSENFIIVTHASTIGVFLALMDMGDKLSVTDLKKYLESQSIHNTEGYIIYRRQGPQMERVLSVARRTS